MKTSRPVQIVLMIRAIPYLPITRQLTAWFIGMSVPRCRLTARADMSKVSECTNHSCTYEI
jgi:hypothetical protein